MHTLATKGYTLTIEQTAPSTSAKVSDGKDASAGQEKQKDTEVSSEVKDASAEQEEPAEIKLAFGSSAKVKSICSIFHLDSLQVEKEMYQPGKIEAKILVTLDTEEIEKKKKAGKIKDFTIYSITLESLKKLLLGRKVTLVEKVGVTSTDKDGKKLTEETKDSTIAQDYLIFKFAPEYSTKGKETSLYIKLFIYSPEKQLAFRKYNKCYVAKKLGDDIFTEITQNQTTTDTKVTPLCAISKNPQHLIVQMKEKPEEYIQPYLVQYDETALNFLNRAANRCGEFLFFEDGEWKLGAKTASAYAIYEYDSLTYHCSDLSEEEFFLSNNYTKSMPSNPGKATEPGALPDNATQKQKDKHEKDTKAYQAYQAYEAYQERLKKGVPAYMGPAIENLASYEEQDSSYWESFSENYELLDPGFWRENLSDWLKEDSLWSIVGSVAADAAKNAVQTAITYKKDAEDFNEKNIKPYEESENISEEDDTKQVSPFTNGVAVQKGFTNDFFTRILRCGEEAENGAIHLKLGTYYGGFKLGDVFKLGDEGATEYIITKVSLESATAANSSTPTSTASIDALPLLDGKAYPARLKDSVIRKVESQTAIVTSTSDPFSLGRIQIRYPWQPEDENPSSPWIRIAAPFTSKGAAIKFMPQKGDEIMVGYEYGDIERPFMIGSLQSKTNKGDKNAYVLKSPNGHYIKFNNPPSAKDFITSFMPAYGILQNYIPAIKKVGDFDLLKEWKEFAGGITMGDKYGFYKINMSTDKRSVSIESSMGKVSVNALTGITISAPNGNVKIEGKNIDIKAGNTLSIKSGTNIKTVDELSKSSFHSKILSSVVSSFVEDAKKLTIIDTSLLRTVLEAFVKPIGGNMLIKSHRFMRLEAGDGVTKMPKYVLPKKLSAKKQAKKDEADKKKKNAKAYNHFLAKDVIRNTVDTTDQMMQQFVSAYLMKKTFPDTYQKALETLKANVPAQGYDLQYDSQAIQLDELDQKADQLDNIMALAFDVKKKGQDAHPELAKITCTKTGDNSPCENFDIAKTDFAEAIDTFVQDVQECLEKIGKAEISSNPPMAEKTEIDKIEGKYDDYQKAVKERIGEANAAIKTERQGWDYAADLKSQNLTVVQVAETTTKIKRSITYDVLYKLMDKDIVYISNNQSSWLSKASTYFNADEKELDLKDKDGICKDSDKWNEFVDCVEVYDESADAKKHFLTTAVTNLGADIGNTLTGAGTWKDWSENHSVNSEVKGKILLSDNETYTTSFNEKQLENSINKPVDDIKETLKGF